MASSRPRRMITASCRAPKSRQPQRIWKPRRLYLFTLPRRRGSSFGGFVTRSSQTAVFGSQFRRLRGRTQTQMSVRNLYTYFGHCWRVRRQSEGTTCGKPSEIVERNRKNRQAAVSSQLRIPSLTPSQSTPLLKFPGKSHRPKALRVPDSCALLARRVLVHVCPRRLTPSRQMG